VIGVRMRFQNPFRRQPLIHDKGDQFVCASSSRSACFGIVIKDRINNRAASPRLVVNDVANCPGYGIEKCFDIRLRYYFSSACNPSQTCYSHLLDNTISTDILSVNKI
jgi:hypothetical protein